MRRLLFRLAEPGCRDASSGCGREDAGRVGENERGEAGWGMMQFDDGG
jgi:hypothetical protein